MRFGVVYVVWCLLCVFVVVVFVDVCGVFCSGAHSLLHVVR